MSAKTEDGLAQSGNSDKAKTETLTEQTIHPEFTGVPLSVCPAGCVVDHHLVAGESDCWHLQPADRIDLSLGESCAEISRGSDENGRFFELYVTVTAEVNPADMEEAARKFERLAAVIRAYGAGDAS